MEELNISSFDKTQEIIVPVVISIIMIPFIILFIFFYVIVVIFFLGPLGMILFLDIIIVMDRKINKEDLSFDNEKIEIYFRKSLYFGIKWREIKNVEMIHEILEYTRGA